MAPTPPLIIAVNARNIIECRRLIETGGANVNGDRDKYGNTALHLASYWGRIDIVRLLLTEGADITIAANDGMTALHLASRNGHLDIVRLLLTEGADITIADSDGMTALHRASMYGNIDVANCLRKWPCTMATIALQELALYYQLDASTIIDLWQYLKEE